MRILLDRANAAAKAKKRRELEANRSGSDNGGETREEREWEEIDYSKTLAEAKEEEGGQSSESAGAKNTAGSDDAIRVSCSYYYTR